MRPESSLSLSAPLLSALTLLLSSLCLSAPAQELENSDFIRVVDESDRGEVVFLIGPVDLPAGLSHESGHHGGQVPLQVVEVPRAGWVHGFVTDMVDAAGESLGETYLHHVNVIDPENRELFSPISRRIMAAGPETGAKELPESMGLPVQARQRLLVRAIFHNPTAVGRQGLFLRIRFSFTPSQAGEGRANVFPVYMDVKPPVGSKSFDLPPGPSSQSWEGRPALSGRLLAAAGHMHQYGKRLKLEDVTKGELLWEVAPLTDAEGRILSIPNGSFWKKGGIPLRSDHLYRLSVTYENPTGALLREGGMGTLGGVFIPEPGEEWPAAAKDHPDYVADLRHTRGLSGEADPHAPPSESAPAQDKMAPTPHGTDPSAGQTPADADPHAGHTSN